MSRINHDAASRLDFVEGVRRYNYTQHVRELVADFPRRRAAASADPQRWEDVRPLYDADPAYLMACGIQRIMQEIAWDTARSSLAGEEDALSARLDAAAYDAPERLVLDPNVTLPTWYTEHADNGRDDIHLVPMGYWGDPLVGDIYDRGGAVYRLAWRNGYDARPGALEAFAALAPTGTRTVLDLGCAFGGASRVFAKALPDAEISGVDISAPALRHAHMVTRAAGLDVTYRQCDATNTGLDSGSFDVVTAFLLLHEVPTPVRLRIVGEAFRLLRAGGTLMFLDIPPYSAMPPVEGWFQSFDDRGNGEHFWSSFLDTNFPEALCDAGFIDVKDGPLDFDEPGYWGSSALFRTGRFNSMHRWVTTAGKPSTSTKENR